MLIHDLEIDTNPLEIQPRNCNIIYINGHSP